MADHEDLVSPVDDPARLRDGGARLDRILRRLRNGVVERALLLDDPIQRGDLFRLERKAGQLPRDGDKIRVHELEVAEQLGFGTHGDLAHEAFDRPGMARQAAAGARGFQRAADGSSATLGKTLGVPRRPQQRGSQRQPDDEEPGEQQRGEGPRIPIRVDAHRVPIISPAACRQYE